MGSLDLKYYWAVFRRRLPYFLVISTLIAAVGLTVAFILPPVYTSSASLLAEPQQIPGQLAEPTGEINPFEQIQIIEQRIMTRANLYDLAQRIGLYAGETEMSVGSIIGDMRDRIEFIGFEPDPTVRPGTPGAIIVGVSFAAPSPQFAAKGANELVSLILQENVRMRTDRASDTLDFFQGEVERLSAALEEQSARIAAFKTQNVAALPDSMDSRRAQQEREQQRLLDLQREESALKNQRATVVWVFERTGRASATMALSPEEEELQALRSQLLQQQAIYRSSSPQIRVLQTRIAALESLVAEQRAARTLPGADGAPAAPLSELDLELAPIDEQLKYIAEEKARVEQTLADLDSSIQATPNNEMALTDLEREYANLQRQYDTAVASLGQAQVGERIEVLSKGQRFTLIEAPIERDTPSAPPRLLIASAGIFGGAGVAIGLIVLWEMLNRSIRRPIELSQQLGIQPIAAIPYMRTPDEQRWKRGVVVAVLALIILVIPLTLFAIHTRYAPLDELIGGMTGSLGF
jgi:polysaccharide chain length determinant protein (PEP-CTERM system associated)